MVAPRQVSIASAESWLLHRDLRKDHMPQDDPPEDKLAPEKTWDHKDNGKNKENSGGHANWVKVTKEHPRTNLFLLVCRLRRSSWLGWRPTVEKTIRP